MLKPACWGITVGLMYGAAWTVILTGADWSVTSPTSKDSFANNVKILVEGERPAMESGNAYLKRKVSGSFKIVTDPKAITENGDLWSAEFAPPMQTPPQFPPLPDQWPNGYYKGYVKNMGGTSDAEGETFKVGNP